MTLIFLIGVGFYFLLMAVIGIFSGRHVKTMEDYIIARRRLPLYLAVPTVVATWFGAGSSMGVSGTVYSQGFYGVIPDPFGCTLAALIAGIFFAAPLRRLKLLTISDLLAKVYGPTFERVSTLLVIPFYIGTLASQMLAMGYIFQVVSGMDLQSGILIGASIVVTYTVIGGMWAVTITDFVQFGLLSLGVLIVAFVAFAHTPDLQLTLNSYLSEFKSILPGSSTHILSYTGRIFMTALGALMGQDLIQRLLASKSEKVARQSAIIGGVVYFLLGLFPLFIGLAGRQIYPALEKPELLIPLLANEFLSPLLFTVFACGLFAAIMSTADSYLLAGISLLTNNVLLKLYPLTNEKHKVLLLRLVNIILSLIALALAFNFQSIFDLMVHSGATLFVALFIPASFGLFWKGANTQSAWVSVICGLSSWLSFIVLNPSQLELEDLLYSAAMIGFICSFASYAVSSIILRSQNVLITEKN